MPLCKHCNGFVPFLELPIEFTREWHDVRQYLVKILEQVRYDSGQRPPNYPLPAVRLVAEYQPSFSSIFVYDEQFCVQKAWYLSRSKKGESHVPVGGRSKGSHKAFIDGS